MPIEWSCVLPVPSIHFTDVEAGCQQDARCRDAWQRGAQTLYQGDVSGAGRAMLAAARRLRGIAKHEVTRCFYNRRDGGCPLRLGDCYAEAIAYAILTDARFTKVATQDGTKVVFDAVTILMRVYERAAAGLQPMARASSATGTLISPSLRVLPPPAAPQKDTCPPLPPSPVGGAANNTKNNNHNSNSNSNNSGEAVGTATDGVGAEDDDEDADAASSSSARSSSSSYSSSSSSSSTAAHITVLSPSLELLALYADWLAARGKYLYRAAMLEDDTATEISTPLSSRGAGFGGGGAVPTNPLRRPPKSTPAGGVRGRSGGSGGSAAAAGSASPSDLFFAGAEDLPAGLVSARFAVVPVLAEIMKVGGEGGGDVADSNNYDNNNNDKAATHTPTTTRPRPSRAGDRELPSKPRALRYLHARYGVRPGPGGEGWVGFPANNAAIPAGLRPPAAAVPPPVDGPTPNGGGTSPTGAPATSSEPESPLKSILKQPGSFRSDYASRTGAGPGPTSPGSVTFGEGSGFPVTPLSPVGAADAAAVPPVEAINSNRPSPLPSPAPAPPSPPPAGAVPATTTATAAATATTLVAHAAAELFIPRALEEVQHTRARDGGAAEAAPASPPPAQGRSGGGGGSSARALDRTRFAQSMASTSALLMCYRYFGRWRQWVPVARRCGARQRRGCCAAEGDARARIAADEAAAWECARTQRDLFLAMHRVVARHFRNPEHAKAYYASTPQLPRHFSPRQVEAGGEGVGAAGNTHHHHHHPAHTSTLPSTLPSTPGAAYPQARAADFMTPPAAPPPACDPRTTSHAGMSVPPDAPVGVGRPIPAAASPPRDALGGGQHVHPARNGFQHMVVAQPPPQVAPAPWYPAATPCLWPEVTPLHAQHYYHHHHHHHAHMATASPPHAAYAYGAYGGVAVAGTPSGALFPGVSGPAPTPAGSAPPTAYVGGGASPPYPQPHPMLPAHLPLGMAMPAPHAPPGYDGGGVGGGAWPQQLHFTPSPPPPPHRQSPGLLNGAAAPLVERETVARLMVVTSEVRALKLLTHTAASLAALLAAQRKCKTIDEGLVRQHVRHVVLAG